MNIRVKMKNAEKMVQALHASGFEASFAPGASASWNNGCCDPGCCMPHPNAILTWHGENWGTATMDPKEWATIHTNASGKKAHKIWKKAGIFIND